MADKTLTVHVTCEDIETGVWCSHCLLPSAVTATYRLHAGDGPGHLERQTKCRDCGERLDGRSMVEIAGRVWEASWGDSGDNHRG